MHNTRTKQMQVVAAVCGDASTARASFSIITRAEWKPALRSFKKQACEQIPLREPLKAPQPIPPSMLCTA